MTEDDRRTLIEAAVPPGAAAWVELGSGRGVFTATLARRLGPGARIVSIDRDRDALQRQRATLAADHPAVRLELRVADLTGPLDLGDPDGVLVANALHYLAPAERGALLARVRRALAPRHGRDGEAEPGAEAESGGEAGRLVVIEYDTDRPNPWVPYPVPLRRLRDEARSAGFAVCREVARAHGNFGRGVYGAVCRER